MLPIFRIIPVGGVLLATLVVILALAPPGGTHPASNLTMASARGALIEATAHPEWRQFLIQAAVRRADEVSRLRDLPDTPVRSDDAQEPAKNADKAPDKDDDKVAGIPLRRSESDPDGASGAINEMPGATIPVDIGETSSTELPVVIPEEKPPVITTPSPKSEARKKMPQRTRQAKKKPRTPKTQTAAQPNLFESLFGGQRYLQPQAQSDQAPAPSGTDPR